MIYQTTSAQNHYAIISAAGVGMRMGSGQPKQYLKIAGKTIIEHAIVPFLSSPQIKKIVVVLNPTDNTWKTLPIAHHEKIITTQGGEQRSHSVLNGLHALKTIATSNDWILVHDAVRPCLAMEDLDKLMQSLASHAVGGLLGVQVRDTLKRVDRNNQITATISRDNLWHALTPQMFRYEKLLHALQAAIASKQLITDDAAAIELIGERPLMIEGRRDNIKITYPDDLLLAEKILC
jgi:2-C-methyl-D-erythritol 4-phosphate cytidylyltransferase